jgi:hypothetical protein
VLGCEPDQTRRRGDPILRSDGSTGRLARTGAWHLELTPDQTDEWDCGEAMLLMLRRLPLDLEVWKRLTGRFAIDVYVSLTMTSINKGFTLSPEVMRYLGSVKSRLGSILCTRSKGKPNRTLLTWPRLDDSNDLRELTRTVTVEARGRAAWLSSV